MTVAPQQKQIRHEILADLVDISRFYGADPEFVIAGGGNTSVKTDTRLFVKASGVSLAHARTNDFVEMDRAALDRLLERDLSHNELEREEQFKTAVMAARLRPDLGQRPSVECVLHHLLQKRLVAHTHSTLVNMLTCAQGGEALAQEHFGDDVLWIPYVDPGYVLARELKVALRDWTRRTGRDCPEAVFMANHGLIVCGDTVEEIREITDRIVHAVRELIQTRKSAAPAVSANGNGHPDATARAALINKIAPVLRGLLAEDGAMPVVTFCDDEIIDCFQHHPQAARMAGSGPLIPDQIVYCKSFPLWVDSLPADASVERVCQTLQQALDHYRTRTGITPLIVLVAGVGMFAAGSDYTSAEIARMVYTDAMKIMLGIDAFGEIQFMNDRDRKFIEDWEVESYRKSISRGKIKPGRASGKIAIVTGAAQGFGYEIAQGLIAEGAHVVLTDLNVAGVEQASEDLNEGQGRTRAFGAEVNVGSGESVAAMVHQVVRRLGGCDLFISNAGVLRAGSVKTQSEREFDLTTTVNYKGYFLCVQQVAPVMGAQHLACPGLMSDIIQINSKSGLQGSNRNGAYAGSKFGSIGLTQSFALELIEDGIKVNSVCPGNFFDGPLWSDPETGLFVQYLRTGKVPGATTIGDVKRFYEAKVPMRRGCRTEDVMKAILYLMDQQYETGQALPVTGGQVMLK